MIGRRILPVLLLAALLPIVPAADALAQTPPTPAAGAPAAAAILRRLPASAEDLKIAGEDGSATVPVFISAGTAKDLKRFQLTYQAAISVMPEASWLTLTINGRMIGRVPIAAPTAPKLLAFDLPAGAISPGWNAVQIGVVQRHRVDCSLEATYELWTQVDPARSGFLGPPAAVTTLDDLPAIQPNAAGETRLQLALSPNAMPGEIERAIRVAERVALRGGFAHPVVGAAADGAALRIAVGAAASAGGEPPASAQPIGMAVGKDGVPVLSVAGFTDADIDRAVADLAASAPTGTPEGLQALAVRRGVRVRPGEPVSLGELGVRTTAFSGRLFTTEFDIVLPPDAYLADYGEARLAFDGGYAAGLTGDARLLVRVNGVINGNLDLDRPGGAVLQRQIVHMPLTAFRPGRNHIAIEAQVPSRADRACDTLASINAKERFLIVATSSLTIPRLARIAQFPSLSAAMAGNFHVTPDMPPRLFLPRQTPEAVAASGTLLVNAALTAGAPTDTRIERGLPQPGTGAAIVVGTAADMPPGLLDSAGVDSAAAANAWSAARRAAADSTGAIAFAQDAGRSDSDTLDAWGERVERQQNWYGPLGAVFAETRRLATQSMRAAGLLAFPDPPLAVTADTSLVLAQGIGSEATPLTLVVAPDDAALAGGAAAITAPDRLAQLSGRAAALDSQGGGATLVPAHSISFFRTRSFSFDNDRLIAAAWVSSNAGWYIAVALLVTIVLGVATSVGLTYSRRQA